MDWKRLAEIVARETNHNFYISPISIMATISRTDPDLYEAIVNAKNNGTYNRICRVKEKYKVFLAEFACEHTDYYSVRTEENLQIFLQRF